LLGFGHLGICGELAKAVKYCLRDIVVGVINKAGMPIRLMYSVAGKETVEIKTNRFLRHPVARLRHSKLSQLTQSNGIMVLSLQEALEKPQTRGLILEPAEGLNASRGISELKHGIIKVDVR
jgi:hypothetical protein